MEALTEREFEARRDEFDDAVASTPDIATYCSCSDWILAAHRHLHPQREFRIFHKDGHWTVFAEGPLFDLGPSLQPLETAWCFSCPLIGPDPRNSIAPLKRVLSESVSRGVELTLLGGIPVGSPMHALLRRELDARWRVHSFAGTDCVQADIGDGLEGFLSRRSPKFRTNIRNSAKRAATAGVAFEYLIPEESEVSTVMDRVLAIESCSWKDAAGESIFSLDDHRAFYTGVMTRAAARGCLRAVFARHEGNDLGYAVGGVLAQAFRGFQTSYDESYRHLSVGNLCQIELIRNLSTEDVTIYDLGMDIPYKRSWGESVLSLINLLVVR